jgi:N-acetylglucosaminyl-diphospho-decaprenol L-rhamnosyltransferase
MPRVAIVIITYNSASEIGACLDALQGLPDVEIIVVDNASADDTRALIEYRGVRFIANSTNAGFAAGVNQGVRATTAPLVLLLNPDARLVGGLDAMAARILNSAAGAVGGMLTGEDGQPQAGFMARNLPTPATLIFEVLGINHLWPDNPLNWHYRCKALDPMTAALVDQPAGAFLMLSRAVWERLGGFDERFWPVWFEDVDFCARIKAAGLRIWYEPAGVAKHSGGHSIRALSLENRQRYWYGSLLEYAAKHYRATAFRTTCVGVVVGAFVRAAISLPREGFTVIGIYCGVVGLALNRFFRPRMSSVQVE